MPDLKQLKQTILSLPYDASIALVTHVNPDGDGFPAILALRMLMMAKGYAVDIVLADAPPHIYSYLNGCENSRVIEDSFNYDKIILVDCHEKKRIGMCSFLIELASQVICIDHHQIAELIPGAYNYINTDYVSAGAIIHEMFIDDVGVLTETQKIYFCNCIYTTILNDTDNFVNSNTDARTFFICAQLADMGLNAAEIAEKFLMNKTTGEMRLVGDVLSTIKTFLDERVLFVHSTVEMLEKNNLDVDATNKMTSWLKGTKGIQVLAYFREDAPLSWKLSLRASSVDVSKIARSFGGGGHIKASGCAIEGSLAEVEQTILDILKDQLI